MNRAEAEALEVGDLVAWDVQDAHDSRRGTVVARLAPSAVAIRARPDDAPERVVWVHYTRLSLPGPSPEAIELSVIETVARARYLLEYPGTTPLPWEHLRNAERDFHRNRVRWYIDMLADARRVATGQPA